MSKAEVEVTDEGQMGARLWCYSRPTGCPGLGGWKADADVGYWTRVKGPVASDLCRSAAMAPGGCITIELDGDRIVSMGEFALTRSAGRPTDDEVDQ